MKIVALLYVLSFGLVGPALYFAYLGFTNSDASKILKYSLIGLVHVLVALAITIVANRMRDRLHKEKKDAR